MKIKKIDFKKHEVFGTHAVIFGVEEVPTISFLVGNNGSGKTKVLDFLFDVLSTKPFNHRGEYTVDVSLQFSESEQTSLGLNEKEVIYSIRKEGDIKQSSSVYGRSGAVVQLTPHDLSKIVYSTVEINFSEPDIKSVTSKNIDDVKKPKDKSQNLSTEIPQLLVDIKALDDADAGVWIDANKGAVVPDHRETRLKRFTDAFHKIYDGEKSFSEIKNQEGSKKIVFLDARGQEIGLQDLSTGEKQVIYRVGYILKHLGNISEGIVLIDEPEISLHPTWQIKFKDFLHDVFSGQDVQIIIATHSPFIFKKLNDSSESCIKIDRSQPESKKVTMTFPRVPYTPSVNLINYLAYGIVDELLHIELYTLLQIRENKEHIRGMETWLRDSSGGSQPIKQSFMKTGELNNTDETIMTWIRNKIHHPDEMARPEFSEVDLKNSIDQMIQLLK